MTAQIGDRLIFQGETVVLFSNPLESYFDDAHPRPKFPRASTACWRGYVATWQIGVENLFLQAIDSEERMWRSEERPRENALWDLVFPDSPSPVLADWYTGELRIPRGERLEYVHMGYASRYERELYLSLEEGEIFLSELRDQDGKILDNTLFRRPPSIRNDDDWAFILAAREQPDDATRRLVYADWLQERGDLRADVIRTMNEHQQDPKNESARKVATTAIEAVQPKQWSWLQLMGYDRLQAWF